MEKQVQDIIQPLTGGIVYINDGSKIYQFTKGYRDHVNKIPVTESTRFGTASLGKIFTAVGILKLIEENRLSLDTTIGSVLSFDLHQIDPDVTIEQLLTHTSGVPNYSDEEKIPDYAELFYDYPNYRVRQGQDLLPLFIDQAMMYPKGDRFEYNDSGFALLGIVIEEVSNKPFDRYINETIFQPLGMTDTGYFEFDRLPCNCANAYIWDEKTESYYTNIYSVDAKGSGAGGAYITTADMNRFWTGLFKGTVLSKETLKTMMYPHVKHADFGYGLGVWLTPSCTPYVVGEDPGVTCISSFEPDTLKQVTLISNYRDDIYTVYDQIMTLLK